MKRHAGFSLLELLVTVSVAGTLATIAVPSLGRLVQDSRRTAVANELLATMLLARSQSAAQGRTVVVCGFDDRNRDGRLSDAELRCAGSDWSAGWFVAVWDDADHDGRVDTGELSAPLRVSANGEAGISVRVNGLANAPLPAGTAALRPFDRNSSNGTITVCDRRGADEARALILSPNGRARLASRTAAGGPLTCA